MKHGVQLLAALLALASGAASAYVDPAMPASLNGRAVVMPATSYSSAWSTSTDGSGVKIGRNFTVPAPGGRSATAAVTSRLTGAMVLGTAARALAAGSGVIGAGMLAYDLYNAVRVHPDGSGGLMLDPGQAPQTVVQEVFVCSSGLSYTDNTGPTAGAACSAMAASAQPRRTPNGGSISYGASANADGSVTVTQTSGCGPLDPESCQTQTVTLQGSWRSAGTANVKQCPAVVDPFDPAYSSPGGPVGGDGKCPSGRGTAQPIDADQAAQHAAQVERSGDVYKQLMDEILDRQPVPIPKGAQTKVETVTPSKVDGPVTSVSGPNGTVETATSWDFGRISQDLAEDFNAGRWNETTTSTTTKPDGTKTTDTKTEAGKTPEDVAEENGDQCVLHPDSLGCVDAGTAPEVEPLPVRDVSLDVAPQAGWGAASGSCPAPPVVTVLGQSITVDNSVICDFMGGIKFVVVGVCALIAAGIILGSRKE